MNVYNCSIHNHQNLETTLRVSVGEWRSKLGSTHVMEYSSVMKMNKLGTPRDLDASQRHASERSQSREFTHPIYSQKDKTVVMENRTVMAEFGDGLSMSYEGRRELVG